MNYPWLDSLWQQLTMAAQRNNVPQALLVTGAQGLGQVDFVKAYAAFLLCEKPVNQQCCRRCRGCKLIQAGNHPDIIELTLLDKSKVIKINQVRQLTEQLQQTSFSHRQVAIIHPADTMNAAAANALLKTLEEPSGQVTLILVSSYPERLPITVRSRCQQIHCQVTDSNMAQAWLKQQRPDKNTNQLLRSALGSPLTALDFADSDYHDVRDMVIKHLQAVHLQQANPIEPLVNWLKGDPQQLMAMIQCFAVDLTKVLSGAHQHTLIYPDCISIYRALQSQFQLANVLNWYRSVLSSTALLSSGVHMNVQLLFESLLLKWSTIK